MNFFQRFGRLVARLRHPVSLPEDIAQDLGVCLSNRLKFEDCISTLTRPSCCPSKLKKYMPRATVDSLFCQARRKEVFPGTSIYSYQINHYWIEFLLVFDDQSKLRRVYLQYEGNPSDQGIEIPLRETFSPPSAAKISFPSTH